MSRAPPALAFFLSASILPPLELRSRVTPYLLEVVEARQAPVLRGLLGLARRDRNARVRRGGGAERLAVELLEEHGVAEDCHCKFSVKLAPPKRAQGRLVFTRIQDPSGFISPGREAAERPRNAAKKSIELALCKTLARTKGPQRPVTSKQPSETRTQQTTYRRFFPRNLAYAFDFRRAVFF